MNRIEKLDHQSRENLTNLYIDTLKQLEMFDGKPLILRDILLKAREKGIEMNGRKFRFMCEDISYLFQYEYLSFIVVGSQSGYRITDKKEDFEQYLRKRVALANSMRVNCSRLKKSVEAKINMSLDLDDF